jgi:hypothetical protein
MALRKLLLRFWVTDHEDCHFREESLEKVTVVTSKRRQELSKSSKSSSTRFTEFTELVGRRAARGIPERISRWFCRSVRHHTRCHAVTSVYCFDPLADVGGGGRAADGAGPL